jgi:hypothetical protein
MDYCAVNMSNDCFKNSLGWIGEGVGTDHFLGSMLYDNVNVPFLKKVPPNAQAGIRSHDPYLLGTTRPRRQFFLL